MIREMLGRYLGFHKEALLNKDWKLGVPLIAIDICISILGLLLFLAVDSVGTDQRDGYGELISRKFIPAHIRYQSQIVGSTTIMTQVPVPNEWKVKVNINGKVVNCNVNNTTYRNFEKGLVVVFKYKTGRITSDYYCGELIL